MCFHFAIQMDNYSTKEKIVEECFVQTQKKKITCKSLFQVRFLILKSEYKLLLIYF